LYGQQADAIGLGRGTLDAYAASVATPDKLQKKAAEKRIDKLRAEHGAKWMEEGAKFTHQLPGDPQPIPFEQLLKRAGMERDPSVLQAPVSSAINPDVPLDRQHAAALVAGNMALVAQIEDAMKRQDSAKSQPVNPQLAAIQEELARARLDQARRPPPTGGEKPLTPNQRANIIGSRRSQWMRFTKAVTDRESSIARIDTGLEALKRGNRNPATQAIIIAFNKLQDEGSVVREGEYARSEQLVPLVNRIEGAIQRITLGGASMTDADLIALANEAKALARAMQAVTADAAANLRQGIEEELSDYNIPPSRVFGNSSIGAQPKAPPAPKIEAGKTYNHPQLGRVRVVGTNPDGTIRVEKAVK
jgi:hypothetical protein